MAAFGSRAPADGASNEPRAPGLPLAALLLSVRSPLKRKSASVGLLQATDLQ